MSSNVQQTSPNVSWTPIKELSHAVLHEVKNQLVILNELLSKIPNSQNPEHDIPLNKAKSLCEQISGETLQILVLSRSDVSGQIYLNLADLFSPQELVLELAQAAMFLANEKFQISAIASDDVPMEWCFDRNLLHLAVMNAVHNCLKYAKKEICFALSVDNGMLKISVSDDSGWYPEHILTSNMNDVKDLKSLTGLGLRFANFIASSHSKDGKSGFVRLKNDGDRAVFELLIP